MIGWFFLGPNMMFLRVNNFDFIFLINIQFYLIFLKILDCVTYMVGILCKILFNRICIVQEVINKEYQFYVYILVLIE